MGYVSAIVDMYEFLKLAGGTIDICVPPGARPLIVNDAVVDFLRDHPSMLPALAPQLVGLALSQRFPCRP
jgi:hypothetical protein